MSTLPLLSSSLILGLFVSLVLGYLLWYHARHPKQKKDAPAAAPAAAAPAAVGTSVGSPATGPSGRANISTFGGAGDDNDIGFTGTDLNALGAAGLTFQGKKLIPIAVFMGDGAAFLYKILEVKAPGMPIFYGIVVDLCDSSQSVCKQNTTKNGLRFLIDIHKSGWPQLGLSDSKAKNYFATGEYRTVGQMRPHAFPKSAWIPAIASGKDSIVCSCTGACTEKEAQWKTLSQCTS